MKSTDAIYTYEGTLYPNYLKDGNANRYIQEIANFFCKGKGLDIGGFFEWTFPGAQAINILNDDEWDAYKLPDDKYDYIFSSHTLEHLPDYVKALIYWKEHLSDEGVIFLYLPHPDMKYWLPQNNRKHLHSFYPEQLAKVVEDLGFNKVLYSERDLYWSFSVVGFVQ